jgi:hypothetical protein
MEKTGRLSQKCYLGAKRGRINVLAGVVDAGVSGL